MGQNGAMSAKTSPSASVTLQPPPRPRPPRRRGFMFYLGLILVTAGLCMIGYVGWEIYGTNIVSHQKQDQLVTGLHRAWESGAPSAGTGGKAGESGPTGDAEALIKIPRFGSGYEMPVLRGVGDDALASGFGHFEDSADPGGRGNYALAAHRVTHGQPLRNMPALRPGDKIIVETRDAVYTYRLDTNPNDLVVTFRDVWVIDPRPHNPDAGGVEPAQDPRLITLTTCAELFHTDNRMIAFGHLTGVVRR
jgi:sortase A